MLWVMWLLLVLPTYLYVWYVHSAKQSTAHPRVVVLEFDILFSPPPLSSRFRSRTRWLIFYGDYYDGRVAVPNRFSPRLLGSMRNASATFVVFSRNGHIATRPDS
jgi:hypothetical protein